MLSPIQKATLVKLNAQTGGSLLLFRELERTYEQKLEEVRKQIELKYTTALQAATQDFSIALQAMRQETLSTLQRVWQIQKGDKPVAGVDFPIPKDGVSPSREELLDLITPLIPKVQDGKTPSQEELMEMIRLCMPPKVNEQMIVETVLEALQSHELPTADALVEMVMVRLQEKKFGIQDIEGLQNRLSTLERNIRDAKQSKGGGGGGGSSTWITETPSGTINGVNTSFTLSYNVASSGKAIIFLLNGQVLEYTNHFTVSGKTISMTFAPAGQPQPDVLFVMYQRR